ncbi:MAG: bifunctional methylenetetrahydrofolate dehydrogenase/methenyltetrahydrofolate cyclohydrolase FolD [Sphingomonadales bacterium]
MSDKNIIDGKAFALKVRESVARDVDYLKENHNITPGLAVVLMGEDPASQVYVHSKGKATLEAGMNSFEHKLDVSTSQKDLLALLKKLNDDDAVHGILVQLPLPSQIDEATVLETIVPSKDVDGFHVINAGLLATGGDAMVACTPLGCLMMLQETLGDMSGKKAVIVGRSNIVGKPMAQLLLAENCTVTIAHSRTQNLAEECRSADILVAAVGRPEMIKGDWVKNGATVIDVGINRILAPEKGLGKTKLVGDVEFSTALERVSAITPVPGGVGPMTIACLLKNTITAAARINKIDPKSLNK